MISKLDRARLHTGSCTATVAASSLPPWPISPQKLHVSGLEPSALAGFTPKALQEREARGWGTGLATGGTWVGPGRDGGERDGRRMGGDAWVGTGLGREDGGERDGRCIVHGMGVDACAADMLVTRTWLHHKHHCRLLRVSAQVERSMSGGSAAPCFAEGCCVGCPKCAQCMADTAGLLRAKSAMREIGWLERSMEGADAAPCFLEWLSEAML